MLNYRKNKALWKVASSISPCPKLNQLCCCKIPLSRLILKMPGDGHCTTCFSGYSVPQLFWRNTYSPVVAFLQMSFLQFKLLSFLHSVTPPQLCAFDSLPSAPSVQLGDQLSKLILQTLGMHWLAQQSVFSSFLWDNGYVLSVCIILSDCELIKKDGWAHVFSFEYLLMKMFCCKHQSKITWIRDTPGRILCP